MVGRRMLLVPAGTLAEFALETSHARWERADVAAGMPQVYAATSEAFVAQMLNLDLLGAIAFDKGCYTGQEVIARAHYRGRVKRRMQRWLQRERHAAAARRCGTRPDGRALTVVRVAPREADGQEAAGGGQSSRRVGGMPRQPRRPPTAPVSRSSGPLPLPYSLPE